VPATAAPATAAPEAAATQPVAAVPACVVRPEVTEGPYYVDEDLNRSDVRSDPSTGTVRDGALLLLSFNVSQVRNGACVPLAGAKVEIWHCDAAGQYSDVTDRSFSTKGQQWLRGYQITDASGKATFTTIYPGWYPGRAVHIHFKVHPTTTSVFTSQLFFDDTLSDAVLANAPYTVGGRQRTFNSTDGIYKQELLLAAVPSGTGYAGTFDIGVEVGA
jgi:protocatechuate 3,4-dioxygenase beta subunit